MKMATHEPGSGLSQDAESADALILDFRPPECGCLLPKACGQLGHGRGAESSTLALVCAGLPSMSSGPARRRLRGLLARARSWAHDPASPLGSRPGRFDCDSPFLILKDDTKPGNPTSGNSVLPSYSVWQHLSSSYFFPV